MISDRLKERRITFSPPPKHEDIYKILLENIYGLVIIKNCQNETVWLNTNARDIFARRGIEFPFGKPINVGRNSDAQTITTLNEIDQEICKTGEEVLNIPLLVECDEPTRRVLYRVDKIPYRDAEGNIEGIVTFMLDATNAADYQIEKYVDDITYHKLRSKLGNIIKKDTTEQY